MYTWNAPYPFQMSKYANDRYPPQGDTDRVDPRVGSGRVEIS